MYLMQEGRKVSSKWGLLSQEVAGLLSFVENNEVSTREEVYLQVHASRPNKTLIVNDLVNLQLVSEELSSHNKKLLRITPRGRQYISFFATDKQKKEKNGDPEMTDDEKVMNLSEEDRQSIGGFEDIRKIFKRSSWKTPERIDREQK